VVGVGVGVEVEGVPAFARWLESKVATQNLAKLNMDYLTKPVIDQKWLASCWEEVEAEAGGGEVETSINSVERLWGLNRNRQLGQENYLGQTGTLFIDRFVPD
jgi:hypothetical protein